MMVVENKYELGQIVYLATDIEQTQRMITMIKVMPGAIMYQVSLGKEYSEHFECEISDTENVEIKVR